MQWIRVWGSCLILMSLTYCGATLETTRSGKSQSLGEAVYEILCRRVAFLENPEDPTVAWAAATCQDGAVAPTQAGTRLVALTGQRQALIETVDTWITPEVAQDLEQLVGQLLPMVDDGKLTQLATHGAETLQMLAADTQALEAIAHLTNASQTQTTNDNLWQTVFSYGGYTNLQTQVIQQVQRAYVAYVKPLQIRMAQKTISKRTRIVTDTSSNKNQLIDFLLSPMDVSQSSDSPLWIASYDRRGLPMPARIDGKFVAPFVDQNDDGLADIDANGFFVDANGQTLTDLLPPFTPIQQSTSDATQGCEARTQDANGDFVYTYFDASQTILAAMVGQIKDVATQITQDANAILGYDTLAPSAVKITDDSVFWDLLQAMLQISVEVDATYIVQTLRAYLEQYQTDLANWVLFFKDAKTWFDASRVDMKNWFADHGESFGQDVASLLEKIAHEPGLIQDLLDALVDTRTWELGPLLALQMRYSDAIDFDLEDINAPATGTFSTPANTMDANAITQQSVFTRILNLVSDANQQGLCSAVIDEPFPAYASCELFQIENTAVFYAQAMANNAVFQMRMREDDFFFPEQLAEAQEANPEESEMEAFTGILGFSKLPVENQTDATQNYLSFSVTPQAAARLLFSMYDERIDANSEFGMTRSAAQMVTPRMYVGDMPFDVLHRGTLFAWEKEGFFSAVEPILQAFAKHQREDLLIDVLLLFQRYWQPEQMGMAQMEPWLATLLSEGKLFQRIGQSLQMWQQLDASSDLGRLAEQVENIFAPTSAQASADVRKTQDAEAHAVHTPIERLQRSWPQIHAWLVTHQNTDTQLLSVLWQQLLNISCEKNTCSFTNTQAVVLLEKIFGFLQEQLEGLDTIEHPAEWAYAKTQNFQDSTGPLWLNLATKLWSDTALRAHATDFIAHVLIQAPQATLIQMISTLQWLQDDVHTPALQKHLEAAFAKDEGVFKHLAVAYADASKQDTQQVLTRLLLRANQKTQTRSAPRQLWSIFTQLHQSTETEKSAASADQISRMLCASKDFLTDTQHGVPRLVDVIKGRRVCTAN